MAIALLLWINALKKFIVQWNRVSGFKSSWGNKLIIWVILSMRSFVFLRDMIYKTSPRSSEINHLLCFWAPEWLWNSGKLQPLTAQWMISHLRQTGHWGRDTRRKSQSSLTLSLLRKGCHHIPNNLCAPRAGSGEWFRETDDNCWNIAPHSSGLPKSLCQALGTTKHLKGRKDRRWIGSTSFTVIIGKPFGFSCEESYFPPPSCMVAILPWPFYSLTLFWNICFRLCTITG